MADTGREVIMTQSTGSVCHGEVPQIQQGIQLGLWLSKDILIHRQPISSASQAGISETGCRSSGKRFTVLRETSPLSLTKALRITA